MVLRSTGHRSFFTLTTTLVFVATMVPRATAQTGVEPAKVAPTTVTPGRPQLVTITVPGTTPMPTNPKQLTVVVGTLKADVQHVNARTVSFQSPAFAFGLGERDVAVFDAKGNELGRGRIQYKVSDEDQFPFGVWILFALATLPIGLLWYDIKKAYTSAESARSAILAKTSAGLTLDELRLVLTGLGQAPTGMTGLARTMMAFMLMLIVAGALFYVLSSGMGEVPQVVDKTLTVVTTALTTVIAFYFGARTAETAANTPAPLAGLVNAPPVNPTQMPSATITAFAPNQGSTGAPVSIAGRGFGVSQGVVSFGAVPAVPTMWTDALIVVPVPAGLASDQAVPIEVVPQGGAKAVSTASNLFTPRSG